MAEVETARVADLDAVMGGDSIEVVSLFVPADVRVVTWRCRDIGYGVEAGWGRGVWGERDWTGKREFVLDDGRLPVFLFDDEVLTDDSWLVDGGS